MTTRAAIVAALLAFGIVYLAGLSYCTSTHGLGCYGVNRGNAPRPLPVVLRVIYDPALYSVAQYYKWRGNPSAFNAPWDIRVLDSVLFARMWRTLEGG